MEYEAINSPTLKTQLKNYRKDLNNYEKQSKKKIENSSLNDNKSKLINNESEDYVQGNNNLKMAYDQGMKLDQVKMNLMGIESTGKNITSELNSQTDKLKNIVDNSNKMSGELEETNATMKRIEKLENKCFIF